MSLLSEGSSEHLLAALWEYVILLEVAFRILRDDRTSHVQNHKLNKPYNDLNKFLAEQLSTTNISDEGDFSERLDRVLVHVEQQIGERLGLNSSNSVLSNPVVTEILHSFDLQKLKQILVSYVEFKEGLWILIDNLDKGWPATGVTSDDTRIIRCLQNSLHKIEKTFRKKEVTCRGLVFIRADVYDILMATTPDKGKTHRVSLDLANREILKEIVRLRLGHAIGNEGVEFDEYWPKLFVSHIGATAEATFDFLIDRCLMRPRCLLELIQACRSNAVTLGHDKVTEADLKEGLADYSVELASNIGFEIRDVYETGVDVIYALIGAGKRISRSRLGTILDEHGMPEENREEFTQLLMWFGVIGLVDSNGMAQYIYNQRYEMQKLKSIHRASNSGDPMFEINPAFWSALEVDTI